MESLFSAFTDGPAREVFVLVGRSWFIWLPVAAGFIAFDVWVTYIRTYWLQNYGGRTLLEIKLPQDIAKSPQAMEVVFNAIHNTRKGNLIEKFWTGFLTTWYSFEISSINGQVRFFVNCQTFFKNLIESQIYGQYSNAELHEVDDYTKAITKDIPNEEWRVWGAEFGLTKEDAYPIKTYVDYKLETNQEEEEKVDPISSIIEFMGSCKNGEQLWFQVVIQGAGDEWQKSGEKLIEKLTGRKKFQPAKVNESGVPKALFMSPAENEVIKTIDRNINKLGFKTGIRFVYVARKDAFSAATFAGMLGMLKQFNSLNLNGFKSSWSTSIDYFFKKRREYLREKRVVRNFRARSYFYPPYRSFGSTASPFSGKVSSFILNSEELATIYHFPGRTAEAPTFERIEARKAGPPSNLPI